MVTESNGRNEDRRADPVARLVVAGSPIPDAEALIRRYCGLPDESGERQVWGYHYFDARPSAADDEVTPEDVSAAAVLNMRFARATLEGLLAARGVIREGLERLPIDLSIEEASDEELDVIDDLLAGLCDGTGPYAFKIPEATRAQISKVLHRKRPRLIPLYDRIIADRYAFGLGDKKLGRGRGFLEAVRDDLRLDDNRRTLGYPGEARARP
jgi:hypothetical protein